MGIMQKTSGMQRLSLSESAVARLIDPRTGERLRPLGVTPKGRVIWPMLGASPDDPSESDKDDEGTDDDNPEGGKSEGSGEGGDSKKDDGSDKGNPDAKIEDLEQEKERHYRRRKEAEKELEETRRELAELKGKDTPEQEKLQNRVNELETQNTALMQSLQESRLQVAFLKDNSYDWHNPGRALAIADLSEVEIDDDGKVHGLSKALDSLAKSDPYLIKEKGAKEDKKDPPNTGADAKNPSKKEKSAKARDEEKNRLVNKYPQLRR